MAYKLTWKGAKWFLRRKYGVAKAPKPLLLGGGVLLLIGAGLALARRPELPG
jgi:hypothetical protein